MKTNLTLFIVFFIVFSPFAKSNEDKIDTIPMIKLIDDIIDFPAKMLVTMSDNKEINCSDIINLFKKDEMYLIDFTMEIARIKYQGYKYDGIDKYRTPNPNTTSYRCYYVINKNQTDEKYIVFIFHKKGNEIIFKGSGSKID